MNFRHNVALYKLNLPLCYSETQILQDREDVYARLGSSSKHKINILEGWKGCCWGKWIYVYLSLSSLDIVQSDASVISRKHQRERERERERERDFQSLRFVHCNWCILGFRGWLINEIWYILISWVLLMRNIETLWCFC